MRYDIHYADSNEVEQDNFEYTCTCINVEDDEEQSEDVAYRLQSMTKKKQDHVEGVEDNPETNERCTIRHGNRLDY